VGYKYDVDAMVTNYRDELKELREWTEQLSSDAERKVEWTLSDFDPDTAKEARAMVLRLVRKLNNMIDQCEVACDSV